MRNKAMIIICALMVSFLLISGGYARWQKQLTITGSIRVGPNPAELTKMQDDLDELYSELAAQKAAEEALKLEQQKAAEKALQLEQIKTLEEAADGTLKKLVEQNVLETPDNTNQATSIGGQNDSSAGEVDDPITRDIEMKDNDKPNETKDINSSSDEAVDGQSPSIESGTDN